MTETTVVFDVPLGTAYITFQQIVIYAASFVYYVLLIRILNLAQIGEVSLLAVAMSIFTTITQLSLPVAATRFISANIGSQESPNAGAVASTTLRLLLSLAGPGLLFAVLVSPIIGPAVFKTSDSTILLVVTFTASFILDLTTLYGAYFLGLGRYASMVYQNILYVPLSRGLGLALAYKGLGPLGIPLGWAVAALATLLLSLYLWRGKLPPSNNSCRIRPLLAFSMPLFATALVTLLQGWGDITLLQALLGQFGTTGAYYIVVSSVAFLSILWTPAASALFPSLSSSYHDDGPESVSAKLGVAARVVNLTVLPAGAALAAVAPTALAAVFGSLLGNQGIPFAILSITIIFSAQGLLLTTTLQAIGKTKQILMISLAAAIADLAAVATGATFLGTMAGAIGRALLAIVTVALGWLALRKVLHAPVAKGLSKALSLTILTAGPLYFIDNLLTVSLRVEPLLRLLILVPAFATLYLTASRLLSVFSEDDFYLLEGALPGPLHPILEWLEWILVP